MVAALLHKRGAAHKSPKASARSLAALSTLMIACLPCSPAVRAPAVPVLHMQFTSPLAPLCTVRAHTTPLPRPIRPTTCPPVSAAPCWCQVLAEALNWLTQAIADFGLAAFPVPALLGWAKAGLGSSHAFVRTASTQVLGVMHTFLGPALGERWRRSWGAGALQPLVCCSVPAHS